MAKQKKQIKKEGYLLIPKKENYIGMLNAIASDMMNQTIVPAEKDEPIYNCYRTLNQAEKALKKRMEDLEDQDEDIDEEREDDFSDFEDYSNEEMVIKKFTIIVDDP